MLDPIQSDANPTLGTDDEISFRSLSGKGALPNCGSLNPLQSSWAEKWHELEELQVSQQTALEANGQC